MEKQLKILHLSKVILASTTFIITSLSFGQTSGIEYVDPNIGSVGHLLQPCRPTVQLPNQMVRMYPMRKDYLDDQISWFPMSLIGHRLGELFGIKPMAKIFQADQFDDGLTYDHDLEITRPYYYSTHFIDENISLDYTPGQKSGFFRIDYKENEIKSVFFKILHKGNWKFDNNNIITGVEYFKGMKAFVYAEMNYNSTNPNKSVKSNIEGEQVWITFDKSIGSVVELKYGFSFISIDQAKKNLQNEIPQWDFDTLKNNAKSVWEKAIGQIQVEGGTESQKRSFYTALYRTYERMIDVTEDGKYYSGFDSKIHKTDRTFYVDDWVWDTYLAHHPLRAILNPEMEADMMQSYVHMYEQDGLLPTFPQIFGDHPCMNGFHSTIMFLDGYRKGITNFDHKTAFDGMKKNALEATMVPWRNGPKCELDDFYFENGFFPALHPNEEETISLVDSFEKRQSVAITLGHSYDDWALSVFSDEIGNTEDAKYFMDRSNNYKNLWRADKKLMWPKDNKGNWIEIDPKYGGGPGGRDYYDENNGWTYKWQVQHDIPGLIQLMGGKKNFEADLDQLFREDLGMSKYNFWNKFPDATGLVGQFSMGNEPSFHIPYLYNFTDSPWKTQKRIRFLLDVWFNDSIFGIPGDEDGGGMTAFVVFSMMGFYPITPGIPEYTIGSPVFEKVTIDLTNGKKFTIIANGSSKRNKYIQSIKLNGKELNKLWFSHDQLINGATIEMEMGPFPNKKLNFSNN